MVGCQDSVPSTSTPPTLIHPAEEHQRSAPGTLCPEVAPLSGDSLYLAQASSVAFSVFRSRTAWHGPPQGGGLQASPTFCQPVLLLGIRLAGSVGRVSSLGVTDGDAPEKGIPVGTGP